MKSETTVTNTNRFFASADDAACYLGIGSQTARRILKKIGAEKRIGKRCIYDKKIIDAYFDENDSIDTVTI